MLTQLAVFSLCIAAAAADTLQVAQDAVAKARWAPRRTLLRSFVAPAIPVISCLNWANIAPGPRTRIADRARAHPSALLSSPLYSLRLHLGLFDSMSGVPWGASSDARARLARSCA